MIQSELEQYTSVYETAHYRFHCKPGSPAESDIQRIANYQEKCCEQIIKTLGVTPDFSIRYYLTNSAEDAGRILGEDMPCNGFAWGPDIVVATYNEEVVCLGPHEDAHIFSWLIANPDSAFIQEGLAMGVEGWWWGKPNAWWVQQFLEDGSYVPIANLLDNDAFHAHSPAITYPIAGAFTQYMIDKLGNAAYLKQVFASTTPAAEALESLFESGLPAIEASFLAWARQQHFKEPLINSSPFADPL